MAEAAASAHPPAAGAQVELSSGPDGSAVLSIRGQLASASLAPAWRRAMQLSAGARGGPLVVDASGVDFCDPAGASLFIALRRQQQAAGGSFELRGLGEHQQEILGLIEPVEREEEVPEAPERHEGTIVRAGRDTLKLLSDVRNLIAFVGKLTVMLASTLRRPSTLRFADVVQIADRAGIGAVPIVALVGLLLGLILTFQSAIPMKRFGAEIYTADLLAISLLRELGPLMAAILLTARSGSAFAAEIGTMKVNEEVDALTTMGLEPTRFLVVPRVIAGVAVVPMLTMITSLAGLVGGALVFLSFDFPLTLYVTRVLAAASLSGFLTGIFKALVFGVIVAGVGCLRGLQTGSGAGAVGESTTSSVVSGIVLIVLLDGAFAVLFYLLGI